jgi:hypothetical protein
MILTQKHIKITYLTRDTKVLNIMQKRYTSGGVKKVAAVSATKTVEKCIGAGTTSTRPLMLLPTTSTPEQPSSVSVPNPASITTNNQNNSQPKSDANTSDYGQDSFKKFSTAKDKPYVQQTKMLQNNKNPSQRI